MFKIDGRYHIIFTSKVALFEVKRGKISVLDFGACYGLDICKDTIYYSKNVGMHGKLCSYSLGSRKRRTIISGLPENIHQMKVVGDKAYFASPKDNCFFELDLKTRDKRIIDMDAHNEHPNCFSVRDNFIYCLYHNRYPDTGKKSVLKKINLDTLSVAGVKELDAYCAHDILVEGNDLFYNNSLHSEVKMNDAILAKVPGLFLRGLNRYNGNIFFGGNLPLSRRVRAGSHSYIFDLSGDRHIFIPFAGGVCDLIVMGVRGGHVSD